MRARYSFVLIIVCVALCGTGSTHAATYDHIFRYGFDVPPDAPTSDSEAARFLTQATFGPNPAEIARLRALGYGEWMDEQLSAPLVQARPFVEQVIAARTAGGQNFDQTQRLNRWFWTAAYGRDQLRQRMAWALSQIFVVSDQNSAIAEDVIPMSEYWDLLARDAFGSYRTLLGDVTLNPTMGRYLNNFHNQKPSATTQPDENYAREVMQLFSVGLVERNLDFSEVLSGGNPIPTYDQTVITHTAKVFTGFTYSDAPTNPPNFYVGGFTALGTYAPMACWGTELFPASSNNMRHDITGDDGTTGTPKTVLGGLTIPPNQTCAQDVGDELDVIAGHANVAPFISRQLIQRFVTSNPSPAYIQRIAQVFEDNGASDHARGDLGAVIKAVLLDTEARTLPTDPNYGKLREPLLGLTAIWRAWNAQAQPPDPYGEIRMTAGISFLPTTGQRPLGSPTVFNFYQPDYQQPGNFADNGLYSPELQITNESSVYTIGNMFYNFTRKAYVGMNLPPDNQTLPTDRPLLDLSALVANASNPSAMVDTANAYMLYGSMSSNMHTTLVNALQFMSGASPYEKAWSLVYLISLSPEYAAQR